MAYQSPIMSQYFIEKPPSGSSNPKGSLRHRQRREYVILGTG
jgi:hypothetical protein